MDVNYTYCDHFAIYTKIITFVVCLKVLHVSYISIFKK